MSGTNPHFFLTLHVLLTYSKRLHFFLFLLSTIVTMLSYLCSIFSHEPAYSTNAANVAVLFNPLMGVESSRALKRSLDTPSCSFVSDLSIINGKSVGESVASDALVRNVQEPTRKRSRMMKETKPRVRFYEVVDVVHIPSHADYSDEEHFRMWNTTNVIHQNAQRNILEWNYERRDWANAIEEQDMCYNEAKGEFVHPAVAQQCLFLREQCTRREDERVEKKAQIKKSKSSFNLLEAAQQ